MLAKTGQIYASQLDCERVHMGVNILAMKLGDSFKCALKVISKLLSVFIEIN